MEEREGLGAALWRSGPLRFGPKEEAAVPRTRIPLFPLARSFRYAAGSGTNLVEPEIEMSPSPSAISDLQSRVRCTGARCAVSLSLSRPFKGKKKKRD